MVVDSEPSIGMLPLENFAVSLTFDLLASKLISYCSLQLQLSCKFGEIPTIGL